VGVGGASAGRVRPCGAGSRRPGRPGGLRVPAGADGNGVSCGWPAWTTSLSQPCRPGHVVV